MKVPYEMEGPYRKKSAMDKLFSYVAAATLGFVMAGSMAWSINQVAKVVVEHQYRTPRIISTEDADASCVIWRDQMSCFANAEQMPEPVAELSYEEAQELLKRSIAKPGT